VQVRHDGTESQECAEQEYRDRHWQLMCWRDGTGQVWKVTKRVDIIMTCDPFFCQKHKSCHVSQWRTNQNYAHTCVVVSTSAWHEALQDSNTTWLATSFTCFAYLTIGYQIVFQCTISWLCAWFSTFVQHTKERPKDLPVYVCTQFCTEKATPRCESNFYTSHCFEKMVFEHSSLSVSGSQQFEMFAIICSVVSTIQIT
jgi:hypothetical protein